MGSGAGRQSKQTVNGGESSRKPWNLTSISGSNADSRVKSDSFGSAAAAVNGALQQQDCTPSLPSNAQVDESQSKLEQAVTMLQNLYLAAVSTGKAKQLEVELETILELLEEAKLQSLQDQAADAPLDWMQHVEKMELDAELSEKIKSELDRIQEAQSAAASRKHSADHGQSVNSPRSLHQRQSEEVHHMLNRKNSLTTLSVELCDAAANGSLDRIRELAASKADVNRTDYDQRTAIHVAASGGMFEVVKLLVDELGCDTSPVDKWGGTPLDDAIRFGHKHVAAYLTTKGAIENDNSRRPEQASKDLCDAAARGDLTRLRKLVKDCGYDINLCDYDKRTAIHVAAAEGLLDVVTAVVEELDGNISPVDRCGITPLDDAIRGGHDLVANFLELHDAVKGPKKAQGSTELCEAAARGDLVRLRQFVKEQGMDINQQDYDQRTAIHLAASEGLLNVVQALIEELGSEISPVDRWGGTPLDDAIRSKHPRVAQYLESKGAATGSTSSMDAGSSQQSLQGSRSDNRIHSGGTHYAGVDGQNVESRFNCDNHRARVARDLRNKKWAFDTIELEHSSGHALFLMASEILEQHDCVSIHNLDPVTFRQFLLRIESGYGNNPFHNSVHGADVMMIARLFLDEFGFIQKLTYIEVLSSLLSALVHDFAHPGTTNAFEVKAQSHLAITHSDQSVLERHHLAATFKVLNTKGLDFLKPLAQEDYMAVRALMVELVLHTDLSKHFDFINRLKTLSSTKGASSGLQKGDSFKPSSNGPKTRNTLTGSTNTSSQNLASRTPQQLADKQRGRSLVQPTISPTPSTGDLFKSLFMEDGADTKMLLNMCIKFADIGHVLKPFRLHELWTGRVSQEFWALGDKERQCGLPISPLCDRIRDNNVAKSQIGFFNFVALPFYKVVADLVKPDMVPYETLQENMKTWKLKQKQIEERNKRALTGNAAQMSETAELARKAAEKKAEAEKAAEEAENGDFKPEEGFGRRRSM